MKSIPQRYRLTRRQLTRPGELFRHLVGASPRRRKVNTSLRFLHEVMGLERLHYGLWDGEELTIEGLRSAQERYSEVMKSWIPEGVQRILDVGCGTGADAVELESRGYEVEALSPDPYQRDLLRRNSDIPFHLTRFQDAELDRTFDLVFMSESAQYIWLDEFFNHVQRVAPNGYLLVADYFSLDDASQRQGSRSGHPLEAFLNKATTSGFELLRQEDLTEQVLPTLELATDWIKRYIENTVNIGAESLRARHPLASRVLKWIFRNRLQKLNDQFEMLSPEGFTTTKKYMLYLFRHDPSRRLQESETLEPV